jgi:hypothetical protein
MTGPLTLDLFDRRFADLVELGRSRIPNLAPAWTDHNYHDPGIMLIDVLAWTAEAQIYALSRMRADERLAYAALLGITPHGPLPAAGLVWPAPGSPAPAAVLTMDAPVRSGKPDAPTFWPTASILLVPARLVALVTHMASGEQVDQASANRRDGAGFDPFGLRGDPGDRLELAFECGPGQHLFSGLAGQSEEHTKDVRVSLGVRVRASPPAAAEAEAMPATRWDVTLVSATGRWPVPVTADDSHGFAHGGALLLDVSAVPRSPPVERFTFELRSRGGFARPPRIECIELNVLPVRQSGSVVQELHVGNGLPDQVLRLEQPGLRFDAAGRAVTVGLEHEGRPEPWTERPDFESSGPEDTHFVVDTGSGLVAFGNGVNGKVPPASAQILLGYSTCAGAAGNLPRSQHWSVRGVAGEFGLNLDPMLGGADRSGLADLRRQARLQLKQAHALVSSEDLIDAALGAPHLQVARAEIVSARGACASSDMLTMVALRARTPGVADLAPESPRWLAALQRALAARLPLGQRLRVIAPRYVSFAVHARLVAAPLEDPEQIAIDAMELISRRLAVVAERPGTATYPLGQTLSTQQVAAWLRKLPGVARVLDCQLYVGDTPEAGKLELPRVGLPLLDTAASAISVERAGGRPT